MNDVLRTRRLQRYAGRAIFGLGVATGAGAYTASRTDSIVLSIFAGIAITLGSHMWTRGEEL